MSSGNEILYIKGEKNTEVKEPNVTLEDILTMECSNSSIMNRIKPLRILKIPKKEVIVFSHCKSPQTFSPL